MNKRRAARLRQSNAIIVKNIPANKNAISSVYSYFKKYGHILSLYVSGTDAVIVYPSHLNAQKAYEDPLSFLNNRFIQVDYYHSNLNANPSNLIQYINQKRVNQFSQLVNEKIDSLIQETEELRKSFLKQAQEKNSKQENEPIDQEVQQEPSHSEQISHTQLERKQMISDLRKKKSKLIIQAAKMATNQGNDSLVTEEIENLTNQIEDLQLQIEYQLLEEDSNDEFENAHDENGENNDIHENGLAYEEVPDQ